MNILIIGKPSKNLVSLLKQSKYADKIYAALNENYNEFPVIKYKNFDELIKKALAIKIDIAINTDKNLIEQGITEYFEQSRINLISVNKKWLKLETSRIRAKNLLSHYNINTPKIIKTPLNFPIVIKTDSPGRDFVTYSMDELIKQKEKLSGENVFLEEYMVGENFTLYAIWDKKNIKFFCETDKLTEVQNDRLDLLKTKLNFMFSDENANFIGIFAINLIWYKNDWYISEFEMGKEISETLFRNGSDTNNSDFLYILNTAIYQKLNEL